MTTMKHRMFWRALATFCALAIVVAAASALFWTGDSPAVADDGSEKPAIPASLVVFTQQGSLDVELDWGEVEKVTHYLIRWRSVDKGEKLNAGVEEKSTSTTIKVSDYGSWVVRVQACNEAGCGKPVNKQFRVEPAPPPEKPAQPSSLSVSYTPGQLGMSATWGDAARATSYRLQWRRHHEGFQSGNQVTTTATAASFRVPSQGDWVVRVEGCNESGCGLGVVREVTTRPARPANLSVAPSEDTPLEMTATWDAVQGATSYLVKWRRDGTFLPGNQATVTGTAATFTLPGHGGWLVRVEGCNEGGCGRGITRQVTPRPGAPTNLVVSSVAGTLDLEATWDAAPGATSYVLTWGRPGKAYPSDNQVDTAETSADITVSDYGTWAVKVQGCNEVGCGPQIRFAQAVWLSVCDRTPQVRDELVREIGKACDAMTRQDLARVQILSLDRKGITKLKEADFQGLTKVIILELDHNRLTALPEDVFDGLTNLARLQLYRNQLTALPEDVFDGLDSLEWLTLYHNPGAPFSLNLPGVRILQ